MTIKAVIVISCLCFTQALPGKRPPKILSQFENIYIYFGPNRTDLVQIPCVADGYPPSRYSWRVNGSPYNPLDSGSRVKQLHNEGTLVFTPPLLGGAGSYQCFADNGVGVAASNITILREAVLNQFQVEPHKLQTVALGLPLTLPCIPPFSRPWANLSWVHRSPDGTVVPVFLDKRVTVDLEGRLHITNVEKVDEQYGIPYVCMAVNNFLGQRSFGPEIVLQVTGTFAERLPASVMWTPRSDIIVLIGDVLRLKCIFAGNPTPDVFWLKNGLQLPDYRTRLTSFGQEVTIANMQPTDAGQYSCSGMNNETFQRPERYFNVIVQSAPFFVRRPADLDVIRNSNATFHCLANGDPRPHHEWYINGVPLMNTRDPRIFNNRRFSQLDEYTIVFNNVTIDDHMTIQCNATNRWGNVFADAYLNVNGVGAVDSVLRLVMLCVVAVMIVVRNLS